LSAPSLPFKLRQKCESNRPFAEDATASDRIVTWAAGALLGTIRLLFGGYIG